MNHKMIIIFLFAVSFIGLGIFTYANSNNRDDNIAEQQGDAMQGADVSAQNCIADNCLTIEGLEYPVDELPNDVVQALNMAIDDEYKARATYEAVINELGSIRPFSMIIRAEEQHISSLKSLYDKYGIEIPDDPYVDVEVASTKSANCSIGVQAEIDNAALYRDSLVPAVSEYPDITTVFTNLMDASQDRHLPAFQKCAS